MTIDDFDAVADGETVSEGENIRKALPTAPCHRAVKVPERHKIGAGGVWLVASQPDGQGGFIERSTMVAPAPVVITRIGADVESGARTIRLAWLDGPEWRSVTAPRETVSVARSITSLAAQGLPVTSTTARMMVDWIAALEVETMRATAPERYTATASRTGWHGTGYLRGVWRHGTAPELEPAIPTVDAACRQIVERGELADWVELLREWTDYPGLRVAIAASASAPLLRVIGGSPYVLDIAGQTSQGKTSAQRIAASVWGNPGRDESAGYLQTWNATRVGIEHLAGGLSGLPLILDDTQKAQRPEQCGQIVYDVCGGQGRIRGDRTARSSGEVVVISSGETPLAELTGAGGLRARCLVWWGSPLGSVTPEMRQRVDRWLVAVDEIHGTAGARVIDWLLTCDRRALRAEWAQLREWYASLVPPGHPVGGRLAGYAATLELGGRVLARAVGAPVDTWLDVATWCEMLQRSRSADRARDALSHAWSWAMSQPHRVVDSGVKLDDRGAWIGACVLPPGGAAAVKGRIDALALLPEPLRAELGRAGYDVGACLAAWGERGWIASAPGRLTTTARIDGRVHRVIRITRTALDLLAQSDTDDPQTVTQDLPL